MYAVSGAISHSRLHDHAEVRDREDRAAVIIVLIWRVISCPLIGTTVIESEVRALVECVTLGVGIVERGPVVP